MDRIPHWLEDNPLIQRLLHRFIDKCERPSAIKFQESINVNRTPELFDFDNPEREFLWPIIDLELRLKHKIIERIQYRRVALNAEKYDKAIIYFDRNSEELVRTWLQRPAQQSYKSQWHEALKTHPQFKATSLSQAIEIKDFSANDIISGFAKIETELSTLNQASEKISLRGLSARCFWGDSKFLDNRRDLIDSVFALSSTVIEPRTLMLSVYVPKQLRELIFVENFDSFLSTVKAIKKTLLKDTTAVVYSAGYRGSAHLIRASGQSQFVTINSVNELAYQRFEDWWFQRSNSDVKTHFWGDFDYEGMGILKALRNNFPDTSAWKVGYELLLEYHDQGLGHAPEIANKQGQKQAELTMCGYADSVLIPKLIETKRFIDQEAISEAQLIKVLSLADPKN